MEFIQTVDGNFFCFADIEVSVQGRLIFFGALSGVDCPEFQFKDLADGDGKFQVEFY